MVVELLLPVWHLTSKLAAAKCLDALQDNKDPSITLRLVMDGPTSSPTGALRGVYVAGAVTLKSAAPQ